MLFFKKTHTILSEKIKTTTGVSMTYHIEREIGTSMSNMIHKMNLKDEALHLLTSSKENGYKKFTDKYGKYAIIGFTYGQNLHGVFNIKSKDVKKKKKITHTFKMSKLNLGNLPNPTDLKLDDLKNKFPG